MSDPKQDRKVAYLRKLALLALRKQNIVISELSLEQIEALPFPKRLRDTIAGIKADKPDLTVKESEADISEIRNAPVELDAVTIDKYDPKVEINEILEDFADVIADVEEVIEPEVVAYSEVELRAFFDKVPASAKTVVAILKKVMQAVEDKDAVDSTLASKLAKEYAAKRKSK